MYSVLSTLSEYTYFYISKNITSYTFLLVLKIDESLHCILKNKYNFTSYQKTLFHIEYQAISIDQTIYFQIYFIYTIKWRWHEPIFGIFHDLLTHCNHSITYDTQNIWHCALALLIRKTLDLWSIVFLVFLACKHELLFQKWSNLVLYWTWSSFHFSLSLQPHNSTYKIWNY